MNDKTTNPVEPEMPKVEPRAIEQKPQETIIQQRKSHTKRNLLIGGGVLLLACCCVIPIGVLALAPNAIFSTLTGSRSNINQDVTTLTQDELNQAGENIANLLEEKKQDAKLKSTGETFTVTLSEKEILANAMKNTEGLDPGSIGIKFEDGAARLTVDVGKLISSGAINPSEYEGLPFDPSMLNGVVVSASLETSPDGKNIKVTELSTGNAFIDSFIPNEVKNGLSEQINLSDLTNDGGEQIESVKFVEGGMEVTYRK